LDKLAEHGILRDTILGVLDADDDATSELCLQLMELLIYREQASHAESHLVSRGRAISDQFVNFLINMILDAREWVGVLSVPRDLIVLIRHQLGNSLWELEMEEQQRSDMRFNVLMEGVKIAVTGKKPSLRDMGKASRVNASTVMRWIPAAQMEQLDRLAMKVRVLKYRRKSKNPLVKRPIRQLRRG
jgi:hypothetical protein